MEEQNFFHIACDILNKMDIMVKKLDNLEEEMERHKKDIKESLERNEKRLERLEKSMDLGTKRLERLEKSIDLDTKRLERLEKSMDLDKKRLERLENSLNNNYPLTRGFFTSLQNTQSNNDENGILNGLEEVELNEQFKNKEEIKCAICLENFSIGDKISYLPCIHFFHSSCIKNWIRIKNKCPICNNIMQFS